MAFNIQLLYRSFDSFSFLNRAHENGLLYNSIFHSPLTTSSTFTLDQKSHTEKIVGFQQIIDIPSTLPEHLQILNMRPEKTTCKINLILWARKYYFLPL